MGLLYKSLAQIAIFGFSRIYLFSRQSKPRQAAKSNASPRTARDEGGLGLGLGLGLGPLEQLRSEANAENLAGGPQMVFVLGSAEAAYQFADAP